MTLRAFNRYLDRLVRPQLDFWGGRWSSFTTCGAVGWLAAIAFALTLTVRLELATTVTAGLAPVAFLTFLGLTMAVKMVTGEENIVYYHHEVVVASVCAVVLRLWQQPVLPYLDVVFLALGLFLMCGRVGCFLVGCCHGRPHSWGVCYRQEHAAAGFSRHFVGVRLFPVQLVEALLVGAVVAGGTYLLAVGAPPGSALAWYSIGYGLGRFGFEFLRGDPGRPYLGRFSEAQWTTLVLMTATSLAELAGLLPLTLWHVGATATLALVMAALAISERPSDRLLRPRHVQQVAELLAAARAREKAAGEIGIGTTSLGLRLSASTVRQQGREVEAVALSSRDKALSEDSARCLARLLHRLRQAGDETELIAGGGGIYHVVLSTERGADAV